MPRNDMVVDKQTASATFIYMVSRLPSSCSYLYYLLQ